ncbi:MAG: TetR/AcrR family transcriptional regulator [Planctomycetota bacterium]|jgi:AcrR family transcriptional regulator
MAPASYHHGDLKRALLQAASDLLEAGGPSAVTLRAAARRVGVSHAAPYRHFADKDSLLAAVATDAFHALRTELIASAGPLDRTPSRRIVAAGRAYVAFALAHPSRYALMFGPQIEGRDQQLDLAKARSEAFDILVELVTAGQHEGELVDGDPKALALFAWSTVHGLAQLLVDGRLGPVGSDARSGTVAGIAELVLSGLLRRADRRDG